MAAHRGWSQYNDVGRNDSGRRSDLGNSGLDIDFGWATDGIWADPVNQNTQRARMRDHAQRILRYENTVSHPGEPAIPVLCRVFDGLRRSLGTLVGVNGFRALLIRALTLAKAHACSLGQLRVEADGSLDGLGEHCENEGPEPGVELIASLLGLLAEFIGESLMLQILRNVWPHAALPNTEPSGENGHDPAR
jgi:hypothetical protein